MQNRGGLDLRWMACLEMANKTIWCKHHSTSMSVTYDFNVFGGYFHYISFGQFIVWLTRLLCLRCTKTHFDYVMPRTQVYICTWSCFTVWQVAQLMISIPFAGSTNKPVMEQEPGLKQGLECLAVSLYYCWLIRCRQSVIIDCEIQSLIKAFTGLGRSPQ